MTRYTAYWDGHGETVQSGVGMLFAALRRGWPWVQRVNGDLRTIREGVNRGHRNA